MARLFGVPVNPDPGDGRDPGSTGPREGPGPARPRPRASLRFANALFGLIALESTKSAGIVASPENTNRFREATSAALVEQERNFEVFGWDTYNAFKGMAMPSNCPVARLASTMTSNRSIDNHLENGRQSAAKVRNSVSAQSYRY